MLHVKKIEKSANNIYHSKKMSTTQDRPKILTTFTGHEHVEINMTRKNYKPPQCLNCGKYIVDLEPCPNVSKIPKL